MPILAATASIEPPVADAFVERFVVEPPHPGPLWGTSFAVKDLFDIAGRTTGGGNPSWRATHAPAGASAVAVQSLLDAGARLVGTTRTDELAYSLDGCNHHDGAPRNPAAPTRLTGGSSSGAASAVASREVDFAVGTDTAGSVRVPAAWCGLLGIRPTHGAVAVGGVMALAPSFDTVGWFARSGTLLKAVGGVLLAISPPVAVAQIVHDPAVDAWAASVSTASVNASTIRNAARCRVNRAVDLGMDLAQAAECLRVLQAAEAWSTHGSWIDAVAPVFGPGVAERFAAARAVTVAQVRSAREQRHEFITRLDAVLPPGALLSLPTVPGPAARRGASPAELQVQRARVLPLTAIASLTGRPQLSMPLHTVDGVPVGTSLLGWRGGDAALLDIAAAVFP